MSGFPQGEAKRRPPAGPGVSQWVGVGSWVQWGRGSILILASSVNSLFFPLGWEKNQIISYNDAGWSTENSH